MKRITKEGLDAAAKEGNILSVSDVSGYIKNRLCNDTLLKITFK